MLRGWRLVISLVRCRRVRGWLVNGVDRMGWIVEQPVQLVRQSQAQSRFAQNVPKHQKLKGRSWDLRSGYSDGASILKKSKPWHFKNSFQKWSIQVLARGIEHIVWSICGIFMELDLVWTWIFYHTCRLMAHWKALWSKWDVKVWLTMARLNYGITHKNNGDVEIKAWLQSKVLVCVKNSRPSFAAAEKASCPKNLPGRRQMLRVFSLKW